MSASAPATTPPPATVFVRDRFTWSVYLTLGYYTFLLTMLGPLAPVLQTRFHLNYSDIGVPTSAYAAGMLLIGFVGAWALRRFAMSISGWVTLGVAVMATSAMYFVSSNRNVISRLAGLLVRNNISEQETFFAFVRSTSAA